jgi:hypothetical protein
MPWVVEEGGITVLHVRLARGSLAFASALLIGAGCWTQRAIVCPVTWNPP